MSSTGRLTADAVTQYAVLDALLAGAYETGISVADVRDRGDFGIGCVEGLGGEVVILDGEAFSCTVDAPPEVMADAETMPFVDVCTWHAVDPAPVADVDVPALTASIEALLVSRNLFHAVRVDGVLASATIRATPKERHPFRPLADVTRGQVETRLEEVAGTLVGFWAPAIYQGITVAGLHLHFLADDRSAGGHLLAGTVRTGEMRVAAYPRFHLHLPTDPLFLRTELTHDEDRRIVTIEGRPRAT